jgi:transposase
MLADISNVDAIYIVCGRTDMRKSIDGLCAIIQEQFSMEIDHSLYLFCGRKCDRIKAILKEPDGIVMIYKRLTAQGSYRWPRDKSSPESHLERVRLADVRHRYRAAKSY